MAAFDARCRYWQLELPCATLGEYQAQILGNRIADTRGKFPEPRALTTGGFGPAQIDKD